MPGPLDGVTVIEVAGIGPGPFCGMMLADMGATVIRVDRASTVGDPPLAPPADVLARGRRSIALDLKHPDGLAVLLELVAEADALIEGFRPGVAEKLGFGPDVCAEVNPALVFGRMTGWGQEGPMAPQSGHDINYISIGGALGAIGRAGGPPVPPINLVGDFGGGGMLLAFGLVCALLEAKSSGRGQVVDAAMIDGTAALMAMTYSFLAMGIWDDERGVNMLDTGAHFYDTYETSDGGWMAVGAIERQFYAELLEKLEIDPESMPRQNDKDAWGAMRARVADVFATRTRAEWEAVFEGSDACVTPVLSLTEAPQHPHNVARGTFVERHGVVQHAPAPRFSRTECQLDRPPSYAGQHSDEVMDSVLGASAERISNLRSSGALA